MRWFWYGGIIAGHLNILAKIFYPLSYLLRKPIMRLCPPTSNIMPKMFPTLHLLAILFLFWLIYSLIYSFYEPIFFLNMVTGSIIMFFFLWVFNDYELYRSEGSLYGEKRWLDGNGYDIENMDWWQKFKIAYLWNAIRNAAWNMYDVYVPAVGERVLKSFTGYLSKNDIYVANLYEFAVLRYVNAQGQYMDNQGDYLSIEFSVLGWSSVWYEVDGKLYYQYSFAETLESRISTFFCRLLLSFTRLRNKEKLKALWNSPIWFELHYGNNERRYTLRMKVKGGLQIFEELNQ